MRIEQTGTIKNLLDNFRAQGLNPKDILIAQVLSIDGEEVLLKSRDGLQFAARLLNKIPVSVGDFVETIVDEASNGRYVLRIVDITRSFANSNSVDKNMPGFEADARTLREALNIMKRNPGTEPNVAKFLSENDISATQRNIETVTMFSKFATNIGKLLADLKIVTEQPETNQAGNRAAYIPDKGLQTANDVKREDNGYVREKNGRAIDVLTVKTHTQKGAAEQGTVTDKTEYAKPQKSQPALAKMDDTGTSDNIRKGATHAGMRQTTGDKHDQQAQSVLEQRVTAKNQVAGIIEENEAYEPGSLGFLTEGEENTIQTDIEKGASIEADAKADAGAVENSAISKGTKDVEMRRSVSDKIGSLFVDLGEKDNLAANIKKSAVKLAGQLKQLKISIARHDITNKDILMRKLESAEKLIELSAQIKHFDHLAIPLLYPDGFCATAELYVYRQRKKRAENESFIILIGIDTQHIGRVEALIKTNSTELTVTMYLEDISIENQLPEEINLLKEAMRRLGFSAVNINIGKLESNTTMLNAQQRLMMQADAGAGIDIRI